MGALMKKKKEEENKKDNQYKLNLANMTEMPQIYSPSDFLELMSLLGRLAITIFCLPGIWMSFLVGLLTIMQDRRVYCPILSESAPGRKGISISALS